MLPSFFRLVSINIKIVTNKSPIRTDLLNKNLFRLSQHWLFTTCLLFPTHTEEVMDFLCILFLNSNLTGAFIHEFPAWSKIFGCILGILPALMLPLFLIYNAQKMKRSERVWISFAIEMMNNFLAVKSTFQIAKGAPILHAH